MPPEVTVLTAVRNGARFLQETIASIRGQTVSDWEYVIVDDASDDDTVAIVELEASSDVRIRLLRRTETAGPYVAANDGLGVATGRYVARIDADDVATPGRLALQLRFLADHPELRACGGLHRALLADGGLSRPIRVPVLPGVLRWRLCMGADPVHSSLFCERSAMNELGGYQPLPMAQDWRLWCRLSRRRWLGIVPDVVVHRRLHPDRLTVQEGSMQSQYALDVAREHIHRLSGADWSPDAVQTLRSASHGLPAAFAFGLQAIDRWANAWRADSSLSPMEGAELNAWTRFLKRRHAVRCAERLPVAGTIVRAGTAVGLTGRRAASGVLRALGPGRGSAGADPQIHFASRTGSGSGSEP
jgi:hypothetical protein